MSGEFYARHSPSNDWPTPDAVYMPLHREFGFTLDACATPNNAKCASYFTETDDGLAQDWPGCVWVNPPYGRMIGRWVAKELASSLGGSTVVMLIPSRTDTSWWHDYVLGGGAEIRYLRGRIRFGKDAGRAPFPSVVVIFRPPMTTQRLSIVVAAPPAGAARGAGVVG